MCVYIYKSNSKFLKVVWNVHDTNNSRYECDREADLQFCTEFLVKCYVDELILERTELFKVCPVFRYLRSYVKL